MTGAASVTEVAGTLGAEMELIAGPDPRPAALAAALEAIRSSPSALRRWLREVADADAERQRVARRSYWHANGFAKIVLHAPDTGRLRVRLHVWPASTGEHLRGETDPHGHRWDFASTVVVGEALDVDHFVPDAAGGEWTRHVYEPDAPVPLRPECVERLAVQSHTVRRHGDIYTCPTTVVHTVEPVGRGLVATLVAQGPEKAPSTPVYRRGPVEDAATTRALDPEELTQLLDLVIAEL